MLIIISAVLLYTRFHKNLNVGLVFCLLYLGIPNKLYKCNIEQSISHLFPVLIIQESCKFMFFRDAG